MPLETVTALSSCPVSQEATFICQTPSCPVVYFSTSQTITADQVKVRVHFKEGQEPRTLCYCAQVTTKDIQDAVLKLGTYDFKAICNETGAMKNCDCIHNNPRGTCCSSDIRTFLEELTGK